MLLLECFIFISSFLNFRVSYTYSIAAGSGVLGWSSTIVVVATLATLILAASTFAEALVVAAFTSLLHVTECLLQELLFVFAAQQAHRELRVFDFHLFEMNVS